MFNSIWPDKSPTTTKVSLWSSCKRVSIVLSGLVIFSSQIAHSAPGDIDTFVNGTAAARGLLADDDGNIYVSEFNGNRIIKIAPDGTNSLVATVGQPTDLAFDNNGVLHASSAAGNSVVKINADGTTTDVVPNIDNDPYGLAFDENGNMYVGGVASRTVYKVDTNGNVRSLFTNFNAPRDFYYDESYGLLFIASQQLGIWTFDPDTEVGKPLTPTVFTNGAGSSPVGGAYGVTTDAVGNVFYAGFDGHVVYKIAADEVTNPARNLNDVSVVAGIENDAGSEGDGGAATSAKFIFPSWVAISGTDVFVGERGNNSSSNSVIRVIQGIAELPDSDGDGVNDEDDAFPDDSSRAVSCDPGFFGAFSCDPAPVGTYVPAPGALAALDCLVGTYNSTTGNTDCQSAGPGYFVDTVAAIDQTACTPGRFTASSGSAECNLADIGFYVDQSAATTATACPSGTTTTTSGATSINDCVSTSSEPPEFQTVFDAVSAIDLSSFSLPGRIERRVNAKFRQVRNTIGWAQDSANWSDANSLASPEAARFVFANVSSAVGGLQAAIRDLRKNNRGGALNATIDTLRNAINSLVGAMGDVAQNRIDQAIAAGGSQQFIDQANLAMIKGNQRATSNPTNALVAYRRAWMRANRV